MPKPSHRASSTERGDAPLPYLLRVSSLEAPIVATLCQELGVASPNVGALAGRLRDPAVVAKHLAALPPLALVGLEVLVNLGGEATVDVIRDEVRRRTGVSPEALAKGPFECGLLVALRLERRNGRETIVSFVLLDASAQHVARAVRGLTLPRKAPPAGAQGRPGGRVRNGVALAVLVAHRGLRLTMNGDPNRTSIKTLLKSTGMDIDRAEGLVHGALRLGILRDHDGEAVLDVARLERILSNEGIGGAGVSPPDDGWVPIEALMRTAATATLFSEYEYDRPSSTIERVRREVEAAVDGDASLERIDHEGSAWVRRRVSNAGFGDGYVNPSFEVLIGPETPLDIVGTVALGCEILRIDRLLTLSITPRSIQRGLAAGMEPETAARGPRPRRPQGHPRERARDGRRLARKLARRERRDAPPRQSVRAPRGRGRRRVR